MNKYSRVLFISQFGADAQAWAYGLGRHGIDALTASFDDVNNESLPLKEWALIVVDRDEAKGKEEMMSFCRHLRTNFDGPILLCTYEHDERYQLDVYHTGIDECIIKPIGIPLALAKIISWLRVD